jgi:hypothetical protein
MVDVDVDRHRAKDPKGDLFVLGATDEVDRLREELCLAKVDVPSVGPPHPGFAMEDVAR